MGLGLGIDLGRAHVLQVELQRVGDGCHARVDRGDLDGGAALEGVADHSVAAVVLGDARVQGADLARVG